jgi:Co/Zn/Cd efflux system component
MKDIATGGSMKTERNILIAFILNTAFSIFELIGGAITGSVAITSDALHDMSDALSIAISYFLERKSIGLCLSLQMLSLLSFLSSFV